MKIKKRGRLRGEKPLRKCSKSKMIFDFYFFLSLALPFVLFPARTNHYCIGAINNLDLIKLRSSLRLTRETPRGCQL